MSAQNRANWVALRTLRQMPKVVGQTTAGETVFEIRSVRLVLPGDAAHFSRILTCSACGRDVPGPAVLTPGDLDHPPHAVLCPDCVKSVVAPMFGAGERHAGVADRGAREPAPPDGAGNGNAEVHTDDATDVLHDQSPEWEAALHGSSSETRANVANMAARTQQLAGSQEALDRLVDGLVQRVGPAADVDGDRPEAVPQDEAGPGGADIPPVAFGYEQPGRGHVEIRPLDGGTDRPVQEPATGGGRFQALEERVYLLAEAAASQLLELQTALSEGLAELDSVTPAVASRSGIRLRDLEERAERTAMEVSDLGELQATLDGGLGDLRSQIAALKDAHKELADGQAAVNRWLEGMAQSQRATGDARGRGRGRRGSADVAAETEVVSSAIADVAREQRELRALVTTLTQASDAAAREAARASFEASAVAPLRRDVRALQEQLAAQNEVLVTLSKSVERLRRRMSTLAPAAKAKPRTTKG